MWVLYWPGDMRRDSSNQHKHQEPAQSYGYGENMAACLATLGNIFPLSLYPDLTVVGLVPDHLGTVLLEAGLMGHSSSRLSSITKPLVK